MNASPIKFMVFGLPRSGTAWAANWLTTSRSLCLHDPLWGMHYEDLEKIHTDKRLGVACTGIWMFERFLEQHMDVKRVILHRDLDEVNASLLEIGMPPVKPDMPGRLRAVPGMHVDWRDLFMRPQEIYEYLLEQPFDGERHHVLLSLQVESNYEGIKVNHESTARLLAELQRAAYRGRLS